VQTAKYQLGLSNWQPIYTAQLIEDLNKDVTELYRDVAKQAITLVRRNDRPFPGTTAKKVAYIGFGLMNDNVFAKRMRDDFHANVYYFDYGLDSVKAALLANSCATAMICWLSDCTISAGILRMISISAAALKLLKTWVVSLLLSLLYSEILMHSNMFVMLRC
jgi:hypothetical protein